MMSEGKLFLFFFYYFKIDDLGVPPILGRPHVIQISSTFSAPALPHRLAGGVGIFLLQLPLQHILLNINIDLTKLIQIGGFRWRFSVDGYISYIIILYHNYIIIISCYKKYQNMKTSY